MSSVTPIVEPSSGGGRADVERHLGQARAIMDLVYICEVHRMLDELDDGTLGWALTTATEHLDAAQDFVGKLAELARQQEAQPA